MSFRVSILCCCHTLLLFFFFFNDTATTEIYTLSLHDALPIFERNAEQEELVDKPEVVPSVVRVSGPFTVEGVRPEELRDRKSTRLNSSHQIISYAVFCLKKKKKPRPNNWPDVVLCT